MSEHLKLSNQLCHRFYVASNAITRAYRPYLDALDITYPQYLVLMALWEQDEMEINQLKQRTLIDGGALSLMLKKMQAKKLVVITNSEEDKRVRQVKLTSKGKGLYHQAEDIPKRLMCSIQGINNEEIEQIKHLTDKIISALAKQ